MLLETLTRTEHNAMRLGEIIATLAKYGLADWMAGFRQLEWFKKHLTTRHFQELASASHEARIRMALTELGTTFIKFGQVLSTRPDIVSVALADELAKLQTATPPDPAEIVREIFFNELGKYPEDVFVEFETTPIASASIGQVHGGMLADGRRVVVKIQHDRISDRVARDLDLLAGLAELAERYSDAAKPYQPVATVRQFRRTMQRELDFVSERINLDRFTENFAENDAVHFPATFPDLCSRRVLTMERLIGMHMSELKCVEPPIDCQAVAIQAAQVYLQMIFKDGFYHADPHPGNYMVLDSGSLGIIDAGMVGRLDDDLRDQLESLLIAIYRHDAQQLTDIISTLGSSPPSDPEGLRSEVNEFVFDFASLPLNEFDLSGSLNRMTDIIRRFGILLPTEVALLLRTLVVLEGSARQLSPKFSLAQVIDMYVREHRRGNFLRHFQHKLERTTRDWDRFLTHLPREMDEILKRFREGKLDIHHEHKGMEKTVNRLVRGILAAALIMGSTLLWSRNTPPLIFNLSLFGLLGYAAGCYIAFHLFLTTSDKVK